MKDYYIIFVQRLNGEGFSKLLTNRRLLSEYSGVSYNTLTNWFIREGRTWVELPNGSILIHSWDIERGRQRVKVKGDDYIEK